MNKTSKGGVQNYYCGSSRSCRLPWALSGRKKVLMIAMLNMRIDAHIT